MNPPTSQVLENGDLLLTYEGNRVLLKFSSITHDGRGYTSRCEAFVDGQLADMARIDLLDIRQRDLFADKLTEQVPILEWSWRRAFILATETLRTHFGGGDEMTDAEAIAYVEPPMALIDPVIDDTINVWAGQGGSLKSIISIMAAYQITTGESIIGQSRVPPRNALILDYEEVDSSTFGYRYRMIKQLYRRPEQACSLYYRNETAPITESAGTIRRLCDQYGIEFVIIDPFINARGGAAESSADTQAAMDAVRSLRRAVLIIDHLKKDDGKGGGQDSPFGSVFTRNLARSVWTVKRKDDMPNTVEFSDRKANHRKQGGPVEYDVRWDREGIGINAMRRDGRSILKASWGYIPQINAASLDAFD